MSPTDSPAEIVGSETGVRQVASRTGGATRRHSQCPENRAGSEQKPRDRGSTAVRRGIVIGEALSAEKFRARNRSRAGSLNWPDSLRAGRPANRSNRTLERPRDGIRGATTAVGFRIRRVSANECRNPSFRKHPAASGFVTTGSKADIPWVFLRNEAWDDSLHMSSLSIVHSASPTHTVVEEVAAREGTAPTDLAPLYDSIDPEALDSLVGGSGSHSSVSRLAFTYCGYEVTVHGDGTVELEEE